MEIEVCEEEYWDEEVVLIPCQYSGGLIMPQTFTFVQIAEQRERNLPSFEQIL